MGALTVDVLRRRLAEVEGEVEAAVGLMGLAQAAARAEDLESAMAANDGGFWDDAPAAASAARALEGHRRLLGLAAAWEAMAADCKAALDVARDVLGDGVTATERITRGECRDRAIAVAQVAGTTTANAATAAVTIDASTAVGTAADTAEGTAACTAADTAEGRIAADDPLTEPRAGESVVESVDELLAEAAALVGNLESQLEAWRLESLLSGPYDACDCRLVVTAGAGGADAQDWAEMLERM
jgi:hypothetical protein